MCVWWWTVLTVDTSGASGCGAVHQGEGRKIKAKTINPFLSVFSHSVSHGGPGRPAHLGQSPAGVAWAWQGRPRRHWAAGRALRAASGRAGPGRRLT